MNPDSNLYQSFMLAADIVVVNVLMVVTSLPLVTAGASMRAGNFVISQLVADEGSRPARTYLREFRSQWRTSTMWWLILLALGALGAVEWWLLSGGTSGGFLPLVLRAGLVSAGLLLVSISAWLFYLEARTPRRLRDAFVSAALAALRSLPATLVALVLATAPLILLNLAPERWFTLLAFYLIIGWALSIYVFQLVARR